MKTKAVLRNLRISPRKVRLLVDLVRGMKVQEAVLQLQFSKKHAALPVKKLIESAMANAVHNHSMDIENLKISEAFVDQGVTLKRWMPRAFGRASGLKKRSSHVTIVLEGAVDKGILKKKEDAADKKEKAAKKAEKASKKDVKKEEPKKEEA
ncbi:MAG: 50S ribosomal protein L22 [Candidatus Magasanikbacteria bacterium]|jgi:large subunit ribosomal protein L22|nr:50S ribosomal protein L22 [Candidatus Magasanikbacteria bacterium]